MSHHADRVDHASDARNSRNTASDTRKPLPMAAAGRGARSTTGGDAGFMQTGCKTRLKFSTLFIALHLALACMPAKAQSAPMRAAETCAFNIAPGPMAGALERFSRVTGANLSFDVAVTENTVSRGLTGEHSVSDGINLLLRDSGVEAVAQPGGGFILRKQPGGAHDATSATTLPQVVITGSASPGSLPAPYAGGQVARGGRLGMLGNTDVMDAPFNITSYTAQAIQDRQARTVGDMVVNDASVRFASQPGGILDAFTIRGFPVGAGNFGEVAFDGVYGVASNYRIATDYVERIEVIKGPTALLYGMSPAGSVGGGINIVPKRALDKDLTQFTADYASSSQVGGHLDLSRRFGDEREFGVRFNGSYRDGDTGLDNQSRSASNASLALDYQGKRLRASLDLIDQREKINAPSRLPHIVAGIDVPSAPDGSRNFTQSWEYSEIEDRSALLRTEFDFNDDLTWFVDAGGGTTTVSRLFSITPNILNNAGDLSMQVSDYRFDIDRNTIDTGLRARFKTGAVDHTMTAQVNRYQDQLKRGLNNGPTIFSNLYRPATNAALNVPEPTLVPKLSESRLSGVALSDTLSILEKRVQLTLGVRHQKVSSDNFDAATGAITSTYDKSVLTPLIGLMVKPWENVSLYANRIEGLSKGDTAPLNASNSGEVFAPYKSKQTEVGVKVEQGGLISTLSAFEITKPSGQLTGNLYSADAEQRNRGLELSVFGEAAPGVRVLASATLIDAKLTRTNTPATVGKTAVGVPKLQANLGSEWDTRFAPGLTLTGNVFYTGKQYVDQANTQSIPNWTKVDLGARYKNALLGKSTTYRLGLLNVFNKSYWSSVDSYSGIAIGEPRTLMLSATVDF